MLRNLLIGLGLAAVAGGAVAQAPVALSFAVKPIPGAGGDITYVEVGEEISGGRAGARPLALYLPTTQTGLTGIADRIEGLSVKDDRGVVPLRIEDEPGDQNGFTTLLRRWRATRPVQGRVTAAYRIRSQPNIKGPRFSPFSTDGGFHIGGMQLYLLPEGVEQAVTTLRCDLSLMSPASTCVTSYGDGGFSVAGDPVQIWDSHFLAGPLGVYSPGDETGWRAYWLGPPGFDPLTEFPWQHRVYKAWRAFFNDHTTRVYRAMVVFADGSGGNQAHQSYLATARPKAEPTAKSGQPGTFIHEMGHYYFGELTDAQGKVRPNSPKWRRYWWYSEGLNEYYSRKVAYRAGLLTGSEYLDLINSRARDYYANPTRTYSQERLDRIGFAGYGPAFQLPYARGAMFWAQLNADIRKRSGGARSLDDVIKPLVDARINHGKPLTLEALKAALRQELGPAFDARFQAVILDGELVVPPANAFGPCFTRQEVPYTVEGQQVVGYQWTRASQAPDAECRQF